MATKKMNEELIMDNKTEAYAVIEAMDDLIRGYDFVSLADLYDLVGLPHKYEDQNWGWRSIEKISAKKLDDESPNYQLVLPEMEPFKKEL